MSHENRTYKYTVSCCGPYIYLLCIENDIVFEDGLKSLNENFEFKNQSEKVPFNNKISTEILFLFDVCM